MKRKIIIITAAIVFSTALQQASADYYVIQLKNGKEITVEKYWDEGLKIRFYREGGSVTFAKEDIRGIEKKSGRPAIESPDGDAAALPIMPETESEQNPPPSPAPGVKSGANDQAEIKERLDVITSNITTLNERKNSYANQKNAAQEVKVKAEQRMDKIRSDTYMTSEDRKQSLASEERKINDAEGQIREMDHHISATEEMINNQEVIKKNLEDKLQRQ